MVLRARFSLPRHSSRAVPIVDFSLGTFQTQYQSSPRKARSAAMRAYVCPQVALRFLISLSISAPAYPYSSDLNDWKADDSTSHWYVSRASNLPAVGSPIEPGDQARRIPALAAHLLHFRIEL